jgi:putative ABC transport system ATP-binding protein
MDNHEQLSEPLVRLHRVGRRFALPAGDFYALSDVSFETPAGQVVAVVGQSGSGKTTLLNLVAGIDRPTDGEVWVCGNQLGQMGEDALARFRLRHVGVVFQFFQLLPTLTAVENVILPMDFAKLLSPRERRLRALGLLDQVGVGDQAHKLPLTLSGGQQQRVAIARALANDPPLLIADEPTGNLDSRTADHVLQILMDQGRAGKTVLIVTHDRSLEPRVDRVVELVDGRVLSDAAPPVLAPEALSCTA